MTRVPTGHTDHGVPTEKRWRLGEAPWRPDQPFPPHARVLIDNDFSGDPDDLFQIVHHLLSSGLEIRGVICSHLRPGDPWDTSDDTAASAVAVAKDVFARMGLESTDAILKGASVPMPDMETPQGSEASRAIIAEAMREDTDLPLFYVAGGGLTDLATAYLLEPRIASKLVLVWIGGLEHDGLATPPVGAMPVEYNLLIDVPAARVLFEAPDLEIWQIPRDVYRQCLVSEVELRRRVAATGPLGQYLYDEIRFVMSPHHHHHEPMPESYALGDSPLVLVTALRSTFEPDSTSSAHVLKPTPQITADGTYRPMSGTRLMRVYTRVDVRLMFEDFYLKLEEFAAWQASNPIPSTN